MEDMSVSERFGVVDGEGEMMLQTGGFISAFCPVDIDVDVLANSLSKICRFNGHTSEFYSVAQHSVLVSQQLPPIFAMKGLLHDGSEAILGDLIRPLKVLDQFTTYRELEEMWQEYIFKQFNLTPGMPKEVKAADNRMLLTEFRDLFPSIPRELLTCGVLPYSHFKIKPCDPEEAKRLFLVRFTELAGQ